MNRLRVVFELFFHRQVGEEEDLQLVWDRMAREIKGCLFTLLALFQLVSLTSYLPVDSFHLAKGAFDQINNLGGIVGAYFSQLVLGYLGIPGYSILLLTTYLAFSSFRGTYLRNNIFKIIGTCLATLFASISCYLLLLEKFPESGAYLGGYIGKHAGAYLRHYFNTTGAIMIVCTAFVITTILTTGMSILRALASLFGDRDDDDEDEPLPPTLRLPSQKVEKSDSKKGKKKKATKKSAKSDDDSLDDDAALEDGEEEEESIPDMEPGFHEIIHWDGKYQAPTARMLQKPNSGKRTSSRDLRRNAKKICEQLLNFQITGEVTEIIEGPILTTYEFKPSAGIKLKAIANLQDDLGVALGTRELRIMAPIPGKSVVGLEMPRKHFDMISLKELVNSPKFNDKKLRLPVAMGKTTDGNPIIADMASMPHLLVAGSTGSGKSVFINSLISGFLFRLPPQKLRMILIDPKMLELVAFQGLPHLISPVITDPHQASNALTWAVEEMERRYALMAQTGAKNIDSYNSKTRSAAKKLPFIVIVVDELADMMMSGDRDTVEACITRLAQKARAAGIHLVIATQRPSTEVITGLIKANIPSRISFKVPSGIDSRTILDSGGAEDLIGRGDMLTVQPASPLRRLHGCFVSEDELKRINKSIISNHKKGRFLDFSVVCGKPQGKKKKKG